MCFAANRSNSYIRRANIRLVRMIIIIIIIISPKVSLDFSAESDPVNGDQLFIEQSPPLSLT